MHFCEGAEGDAAHIEAMRDVVSNFSDAHIQDKHWRQKIGLVDMFGAWLKRRGYGEFFK